MLKSRPFLNVRGTSRLNSVYYFRRQIYTFLSALVQGGNPQRLACHWKVFQRAVDPAGRGHLCATIIV